MLYGETTPYDYHPLQRVPPLLQYTLERHERRIKTTHEFWRVLLFHIIKFIMDISYTMYF